MSFMRKNLMLFVNSLYLSAFTFGGGFVMLPLMRKKYVTDLKLLSAQEMIDISSIAQASPGAIAINSNVLIGYRLNGIVGALVCMIGACLPPLLIITVMTYVYNSFATNPIVAACLAGMQAGIAALICNVALNMSAVFFKTKDIISILMLPVIFVLNFFLGLHVLYIFAGCIAISLTRIIIFTIRNGFIARHLIPTTSNVNNTNTITPNNKTVTTITPTEETTATTTVNDLPNINPHLTDTIVHNAITETVEAIVSGDISLSENDDNDNDTLPDLDKGVEE